MYGDVNIWMMMMRTIKYLIVLTLRYHHHLPLYVPSTFHYHICRSTPYYTHAYHVHLTSWLERRDCTTQIFTVPR